MPLIQTPFLGSAYISRTRILEAQQAINIYPELVETKDGKEVGGFYGTPGLDLVATIGTGPWRALRSINEGLFGISGHNLYQITGSFTGVLLGTLASDTGTVGMVDSGKQILMVDGDKAYGYDIGTNHFAQIELPFETGFPLICAYQDHFFLINQTGTQNWWQSDLTGGVFVWNALDFSQKDGQPDNIVSMVDNHREVWLFGSQTTEVWINAGLPGFSFQRLQGVFLQEGCAAAYSVAIAGNSPIWLSQGREGRGVVLMAHGYQTQRISTHAIEREIQSYARIDDALAYTYQQEGHLFYVLTFPSADVTWCFDVATGLWHRRAAWDNGAFHRHRSNCCALLRGQSIVGDFENSNLYAFNLDTYDDAGQIRKWLRSWHGLPTGQTTLKKMRINSLQIYMEPGGGTPSPMGIRVLDKDYPSDETFDDIRIISGVEDENSLNPQVMLRQSVDGGLSWLTERWEPVGKMGETQWRIRFRRLQSARDPVFELSGTDPFKPALIGAFMDADLGIS